MGAATKAGPPAEQARPEEDAVRAGKRQPVMNRPAEWDRIFRGSGRKGWKGGRRDRDRVWRRREWLALCVFMAHTWSSLTLEPMEIPYLACKAGLSTREFHRALKVLCDPSRAGVLFRRKEREDADAGSPETGRWKVNVYTWNLDRFAECQAMKAADRPASWDPPGQIAGDSDSLSLSDARQMLVTKAILAAGMSPKDAVALTWIRAARRRDRAEYRHARARINAGLRIASQEKWAREEAEAERDYQAVLDRELPDGRRLVDVARAPDAAPPPPPSPLTTSASPAPPAIVHRDVNPEDHPMMTKEQLLEKHPKDDLIKVLIRHAEIDGRDSWSGRVLADMLEAGLRLGENHRKTLRRMQERDERDASAEAPAARPRRGGARPGNLQGPGSRRPKGADR